MKSHFMILLFFASTLSYSQGWGWAKSSQLGGVGEGMGIATDNSGNVFICGLATSTSIAFGTHTISGMTYFTKYDAAGNALWARTYNAISVNPSVYARAISTDNSGNSFLTGNFTGTISFGSYTVSCIGASDTYLVKYDPNGNVLWAKTGGSTSLDLATAVCTDSNGNTIITGTTYSGVAVWGSNTLTINNNIQSFMVKYSPGGNELWAVTSSGNGNDYGRAVGCDASTGEIYLSGATGTAAVSYGTVSVNAINQYYVFKFDPAGNALWGFSSSGTGSSYVYALSADPAGNFYIGGGFNGSSMTIGGQTFTQSTAFNPKCFVSKYNSAGNPVWTNTITGQGITVWSLAAHVNGVFVSGSNGSNVTFSGNTYTIVSNEDPMFLASYTGSGNFTGANLLLSGGDDENDVAAFGPCVAYIGGDYRPSVFSVGTTTLYNVNTSQEGIFAAKYVYGSEISISGISSTLGICIGQTVGLSANNVSNFTWSNGSTLNPIFVSPSVTTTYSVSGQSTCGLNFAAITVTVYPIPQLTIIASSYSVCAGKPVVLTAGGAITYSWSNGMLNGTVITPTITKTYTVTGESVPGCINRDTITVGVIPIPPPGATSNSFAICVGQNAVLSATGAASYTWLPPGIQGPFLTVTPLGSISYTVIKANSTCTNSGVVNLAVNIPPIIVISPSTATICAGSALFAYASGASTYSWTNYGTQQSIYVTPNVSTIYTVTGTDTNSPPCSTSATMNVKVISCTGIESFTPANASFIFNDNAAHQLKVRNAGGKLLRIIDCCGKTITEMTIPGEETNIDTANFAYGVYIYLIYNDNRLETKGKIVVDTL